VIHSLFFTVANVADCKSSEVQLNPISDQNAAFSNDVMK